MLGCGGGDSPPADVAGNYTIAVTNEENACELENWTAGETAMNIPLAVTQSGASVTGTLGGLVATWFDVIVGDHTFEGDVSGATVEMTLFGTRNYTSGGCAATLLVELHGVLSGDLLQGTVRYSFETNGSPECGTLATCANIQRFNGTRPPS